MTIDPTPEMIRNIRSRIGGSEIAARSAAEAVLAIVERDQATELTDLRALFQLQWTRSREADARWRAEDPEARANITPDLGVLLRWLMDSADQAYGRGRDDEAAGLPLPDHLADPHCGKPVGEHMLCARPPGHGFPPCGFPVGGDGRELAS